MKWDKEKIKAVLPHREPFLFIEEIVEVNGTQKIVASNHFKGTESFFEGHFPGNPVVPGVLVVEAMAQASIILYSIDRPGVAAKNPAYYLGRSKAEFLAPVYPGDKLIIEITKLKFTDSAGVTDAVTRVDNKITAKANLVFSIQTK